MKALRKEFWMEIRKSKSRFISILLIVALGVAFFSGIQASSPDMRYSGDAYYDESSLMDIKVVGTMGLTCLLYTSPSPRDRQKSRMPSSA